MRHQTNSNQSNESFITDKDVLSMISGSLHAKAMDLSLKKSINLAEQFLQVLVYLNVGTNIALEELGHSDAVALLTKLRKTQKKFEQKRAV